MSVNMFCVLRDFNFFVVSIKIGVIKTAARSKELLRHDFKIYLSSSLVVSIISILEIVHLMSFRVSCVNDLF